MAGHVRVRPGHAGLTLVELLGVVWLLLVLLAIGTPALLSALDDFRARSAARYISGQCYRLRSEAVISGARTAMRFVPEADDYAIGRFRDGNKNGIRSAEITAGIDPRIAEDVSLGALFPGVRFAIRPDVPLIDGGYATDPIRLGVSKILTFAPNGTATGGSLYLRGRREAQYAVRVFGVTGRTRVFKYMSGTWKPL